ncbi:MAG TPA: hypothetical protein VGC92_04415 [Phenylobacterium sp.]
MPTAVPITVSPTPRAALRGGDPAAGLVRRILVLAAASFVIGFVGFLALGVGQPINAAAPEQTAAVSEPAADSPSTVAMPTSDDWNIPKKI